MGRLTPRKEDIWICLFVIVVIGFVTQVGTLRSDSIATTEAVNQSGLLPVGKVSVGLGTASPEIRESLSAPESETDAVSTEAEYSEVLSGTTSKQEINETKAAVANGSDPVQPLKNTTSHASIRPSVNGQSITDRKCTVCHGTGLMGAPRIGDAAAWDLRLAQGFGVLVVHAVEGFNAMPPRGGDPGLSDVEIQAAILHMLADSGLVIADQELVYTEGNKAVDEVNNAADESHSEFISGNDGSVPDRQAESGKNFNEPAVEMDNQENAKNDTTVQAITASTTNPVSAPKTRKLEEEQAPVPVMPHPGEDIFNNHCIACHGQDSKKAIAIGDRSSWVNIISVGVDELASKTGNSRVDRNHSFRRRINEVQVRQAIEYIMAETFWPASK